MADHSLPGLITSLALPWLAGAVWVLWLLRQSGRWNTFVAAGHGYLVGIFLTTLLIRGWHAAGLTLQFWGLAATLGGIALAGLAALYLQAAPARQSVAGSPLRTWQVAISALFLGLIALRYLLVAQEIWLRPLFPWDAWMVWSPKAVAWFHHNDLVPWVSPRDWLNAPADALHYTAGAGRAWMYPVTIPLLQLWGMMGAGVSDHTLIYLPWLGVATALGLTLYGHLRLAGVSVPTAILACYLLLNLPYVGVHVALAGYADIWVAAAFGGAVFALHEWHDSRRWPWAALALFLALMCTQLKIPGLIMGGIVLLVFLVSVIRPGVKTGIALLVVVALAAVYVLAIGVDVSIEGVGRIALSRDGITLPYIGYYDLSYHPVHRALINTTLVMINWNLLWYLFGLFALLAIAGGNALFKAPSVPLFSVLLALLFILFVYYFSNRYVFALDYTQVNRALVYVVPPLVFYLVYSWSTPRLGAGPRSRLEPGTD